MEIAGWVLLALVAALVAVRVGRRSVRRRRAAAREPHAAPLLRPQPGDWRDAMYDPKPHRSRKKR